MNARPDWPTSPPIYHASMLHVSLETRGGVMKADSLMETTPAQLDQIQSRLQEKLGGRVRDFRLLLHDCGIVLRGRADTFHAKQLAQHAVMNEIGLPIVAN